MTSAVKWVQCTGAPAIDIRKEISIDSGATWHDANDAGTAVVAPVPSGAWYRLIVKNVGNVPLTSVTVEDATLGISPTPISNLTVGQEVIIGAGAIAALNVATRCDRAGTFTNVAVANGTSADGIVTDSDPAVLKCEQNDTCLTHTPGFWGTHPGVTAQYLPLTVCGKPINKVLAENGTGSSGSPGSKSSIEAMCISAGDAKLAGNNMTYLQLVRHLVAAKLSVAASATAPVPGTCTSFGYNGSPVNVDALIASCESLCGASATAINSSGCIDKLDVFINSDDTLAPFGPFVSPGPADSTQCKKANGNGWIVK